MKTFKEIREEYRTRRKYVNGVRPRSQTIGLSRRYRKTLGPKIRLARGEIGDIGKHIIKKAIAKYKRDKKLAGKNNTEQPHDQNTVKHTTP